jgi:hypothetical protein
MPGLTTLQDYQARWREIIAEEAARSEKEPEQFKAAVLGLYHQMEGHLSAADCEAFVAFAVEETAAGEKRVEAAEATYYEKLRASNALLQQPLTVPMVCPSWFVIAD